MRVLAQKQLLTASKDLSNGGIIGTTLLMLEYAQKGATIDLAAISTPKKMDLSTWLKMYISTGFIVSTIPANAEAVLSIFEKHGLSASKIGNVDSSQKLKVQLGDDKITIFDFNKEVIVAPPPPPQLDRIISRKLKNAK
jgi:selenophosphate synthetase-related protein